jgi:hypothetical protein
VAEWAYRARMAEDRPSPEQEIRRLYEDAESRVAKAAERVVGRDSFGELLAVLTENAVAVTRIGYDAMDLLWSNLRIASKQDLLRVGRRLGRTEDKLELVLQEVERLRETVERRDAESSGNGAREPARRRSGQRGRST